MRVGPLGRGERRDIDRWVRRVRRRGRIPGLSLGLLRGARPVLAAGWGYRDRARRLAATSQTIYGIASVTKSFTALAILRLAETGRLRLSDPVIRHLPEFRTPNRSPIPPLVVRRRVL